jgi:hypothetical protein
MPEKQKKTTAGVCLDMGRSFTDCMSWRVIIDDSSEDRYVSLTLEEALKITTDLIPLLYEAAKLRGRV